MISKKSPRKVLLVTIALALVAGAATGYGVSYLTRPAQTPPSTVTLNILADWNGAGGDAFVVPSHLSGSVSSTSSDNSITVQANTPVKFIINNLDTAVNQNFTGTAANTFTIYNDTDSGMTGVQYSQGQTISNLPIGHSFSIANMINIPIPPDTVVMFTYTFTKTGTYQYYCQIPCGPGHPSMNGSLTVTA